MRKILTLSFMVFHLVGWSQYSYFNTWLEEDVFESGSESRDIFYHNDELKLLGIRGELDTTNWWIRTFNNDGTAATSVLLPCRDGIYNLFSDQLIEFDDGTYFGIANQNVSGVSGLGCYLWFDENLSLYRDSLIQVQIDDTLFSELNDLKLLNDGNLLLVGEYGIDTVDNWVSDYYHLFLRKITPDGTLIWERIVYNLFGGAIRFSQIEILPSGEILISFQAGVNGQKDHWIIKCDTEGNFLDSYTWGSDLEETYPLMKPLPDGAYAVFYEITTWQDLPGKMVDLHCMIFDPNTMEPVPGSDQLYITPWTGDYSSHYRPKDLEMTPDGGFVFLMDFRDNDDVYIQSFILKTNSDLEYEWMKTYLPNAYTDYCGLLDIEVMPDGGIMGAGFVYVTEAPGDFEFVDRSWNILLDPCGDEVYNDCPFVGVEEHDLPPLEINIYPNPTSNILTIDLKDLVATEIRLTDISGRIVLQQLGEWRGQHVLDVSNLANGIYTLALQTNKGSVVQMMEKR
jgi:Secretion system C-terminal sorting domain